MKILKYRDAGSGEYVTKEYADANPLTTASEVVEIDTDHSVMEDYPGVPFEQERDVLARPEIDTPVSTADVTAVATDDLSLRVQAYELANKSKRYDASPSDVLKSAKAIEGYLRGEA